MKVAIFSNLDFLLPHISQSLVSNGSRQSEILYEQDNDVVGVISCDSLDIVKTSIFYEGVQIADNLINPEDALYVTHIENLYDYALCENNKGYISIIEFNANFSIHNFIKSQDLALSHIMIDEFEDA